jgi:hypothetical protein
MMLLDGVSDEPSAVIRWLRAWRSSAVGTTPAGLRARQDERQPGPVSLEGLPGAGAPRPGPAARALASPLPGL